MAAASSSRHIDVDSSADRQEAVSDVLFYSIGEGAIMVDDRGSISRVNKVALDILGYAEEDIVGKWYPKALIAEKEDGSRISNIERPITEAFLRGQPVNSRLYYIRKDGRRVPVALNVSPITLGDKPIGAIQLFRDITEELQLERAKDEFISIASHQLRTPATVVKQNLGMIIEGFVSSPEQQAKMLRTAYDHNNNQLEIISDLLNIAQIEAGKLKPNFQETDLVTILEKVISGQRPDYTSRNIELTLVPPNEPLIANVDRLHMQMVFDNLLNNAQKYSPPHTRVTVTTKLGPKSVFIRVSDQGYGIPAKDIPRLFQKFTRMENIESTASGTGLGLYWAKRLIELHGGSIGLTSTLNKGTSFTVKLPRGKS